MCTVMCAEKLGHTGKHARALGGRDCGRAGWTLAVSARPHGCVRMCALWKQASNSRDWQDVGTHCGAGMDKGLDLGSKCREQHDAGHCRQGLTGVTVTPRGRARKVPGHTR